MSTMYGIDWNRLYVLNELIQQPVRVPDLLIHPERQSHVCWQFPGRHFLRAPLAERKAALYACCDAKEVVAYVRDEELRDWREVTIKELRLNVEMEPVALANLMLVISERGHATWESLFEPDWSRFWNQNSSYCGESPYEQVLEIICAGERVLEELLPDAPLILGLDLETPILQVESSTQFGVQVTIWKVLPTVKRVQWKGTSFTAELGELMRKYAPDDPRVGSLVQHRVSDRTAAIKRLTRLSSKWKYSDDASNMRDDALPELLD